MKMAGSEVNVSRSTSPKLTPYSYPEWAKTLTVVPQYRIKLANTNTPIHKWNLPNIPEGYSISIKRDDMTGSTLSGNKVRKLEFLLADAVNKHCRHVITCGQLNSNHCRSTALAAREAGLKPHLLILSQEPNLHDVCYNGNFLLDIMCGAEIYKLPGDMTMREVASRMEVLARNIKEDTGEETYVIQVGGSNKLGLFGYISVFEELLSQNIHEDFDDIVLAVGSGGTALGLALANFLTGSKIRIHAVKVHQANKKYLIDGTDRILKEENLSEKIKAVELFDIIDGYVGEGYGISTKQELEFLVDVSQQTGIVLDPVYTGKAARGLIGELFNNPQRFQGNRILFLHTGGIFGLFDGKMENVIKQTTKNCVKMWSSVKDI